RFVYGYLVGNTTYGDGNLPYVVMTARWQHAWTEVLVPVTNPLPPFNKYLEWVIFDPLFAPLFPDLTGGASEEYLEQYKNEPIKFVNPFTINPNPLLYTDSLNVSERRIGLANAVTGNPLLDKTGILNFPMLAADPDYIPNFDSIEILCDNPATPTAITVAVSVVENNMPISIGGYTYVDPPAGISNTTLKFYMYKNTDDQKVPLESGSSEVYVYATTNSTGYAEFTFNYSLIQGLGDVYFYVEVEELPPEYVGLINLTDYVAGISDAMPFNTQWGSVAIQPNRTGYDPYVLDYGSPSLVNVMNEKAAINNKKTVNPVDLDQYYDGFRQVLIDLASDFEKGYRQRVDQIIDYTSDLIQAKSMKGYAGEKGEHMGRYTFDSQENQLSLIECFLRKKDEGIDLKVLNVLNKK
ncbi:MAG: hypothetical protein ACTSP4_14445, partial [Candidatus Hodarchaeales archaeon]